MSDNDVITTREAAEILGIAPVEVVRLVKHGRLPVFEYRFRRSDVEGYAEEYPDPRRTRA